MAVFRSIAIGLGLFLCVLLTVTMDLDCFVCFTYCDDGFGLFLCVLLTVTMDLDCFCVSVMIDFCVFFNVMIDTVRFVCM